MGEKVSRKALQFVSFEPTGGGFRGLLSVEAAVGGECDPEALLREATGVYRRLIGDMRSLLADIDGRRRARISVPAREVWKVGDLVFGLRHELAQLGLELDGVYDHLTRDLGVKRKWLEKAIILRRYIDDMAIIPESLNWGRCEKGTARVARRLTEGPRAE